MSLLKELVIFSFLFHKGVFSDYIRGCYYTDWSQFRSGIGQYYPENYEANLCTHIFYAFTEMTSDYKISPHENNELNTSKSAGMFFRMVNLKQQQPNLKILLSFGGYDFCQDNKALLDGMAANAEHRKTFIDSVVQLVNLYKFDGFDIDWEYPSVASDFTELIKDFRTAFDRNTPKLLLSVAGAASPKTIDSCYEVDKMAPYLDMLNIMTYAFHSASEKVTGQNSPLYDCNDSKNESISDAVNKWVSKGFPKNKINIGFASYGRGWTLASANNKGVGAPTAGPSVAQPYTKQAGSAAYYELCDILEQGGSRTFDNCSKCPDIVLNTQWYSYDDVDSLKIKLDWLKQNDLAGAFVWTLDMDDFTAHCSSSKGKKYPLISALKQNLITKNKEIVTK